MPAPRVKPSDDVERDDEERDETETEHEDRDEPQADASADEEQFELRRVLGSEGPEITRFGHHVLVGAFYDDWLKLRANPDAKLRSVSRSYIAGRVKKWLDTPVKVDNPTGSAEKASV
jgi:hypothetical protein